MPTRLPAGFLAALSADFAADFFSTAPADLEAWGRDWTRVHAPAPSLVAWPRTTHEVASLVRLCHQHKVGLVPSGGRTGLAGGAVARDGEVVLSLDRMRRLGPVDLQGQTVRAQAGAVTQAVHDHVAAHGLFWPVDFASKGSSQVGGNIATNAGGVRVIRYGLTRNWVLGLEVVTGAGQVLELNGALEKNNSGADLRQLFIGSEGIFGVVTEATLKLTRLPQEVKVLLFAVDGLAGVLALFQAARKGPFTVMAYEFFTAACSARLERHRKLQVPFERTPSHCVLLEVEAAPQAELEAWVQGLFDSKVVQDGTLAQSQAQARELWALREGISESLAATGLPHKNDVALPIAGLGPFCEELEAVMALEYPGFEICLFGHIGDGNLHVNVMKPEAMSKEEFLQKTHAVDATLMALVRAHGGSVSAEHGIGLLKKDWLGYTRSPAELALMRSLKAVLDPKGILNPGKVL